MGQGSYSFNSGIGKTFSEEHISAVVVFAQLDTHAVDAATTATIKLQKYDGSVWTDVQTLVTQTLSPSNNNNVSFSGFVNVDDDVQGLRIFYTGNNARSSFPAIARGYILNETSAAESIIAHTIPSGTFPSNISSAVGSFVAQDWETGADVQYKLTKLVGGGVFNIIEASAISSASDFQINDCVIQQISSGKWVLFSPGAVNSAEARKNIYKTLFYGTNGSNQRILSPFITGLTALKTNFANDVGKRAYRIDSGTSGSPETIYRATYTDTTTNLSCLAWARVNDDGGGSSRFAHPTGTNIATASGSVVEGYSSVDNPASSEHGYINANNSQAVIVCNGSISFSKPSGSGSEGSNIDYKTTHSIPDYTIANETITNEDTGWLNPNIVEDFTAFTSEPTELIVKLIPKESSPTAGYPSIRGFSLRAE
jgi:hypothetical protein